MSLISDVVVIVVHKLFIFNINILIMRHWHLIKYI